MHIRDGAVLGGVILILAMLVIPFPSPVLSLLIILNFSLALLILLVAMNTKDPLEFSIFPSLLLLVTLFRLGLNVSTTRAILGRGEAGDVIHTFGEFVIGGNVVVGFVIFLILIVIQFVVITKGAERVSEVAARFTLDAMPGKQMSIDADLNAGMISEREASRRREKIERESDFYGAMDGASKFVKGDAIAGIVIVVINIVFGMVIGVLQMGMSVAESAQTFTLLTVGDGLVSQIPALIVSTAAGIVVTRAASEGNLGFDISRQILAFPKMLFVASAFVFALGLLTPINDLLTLPIALLLAGGGYYLLQVERKKTKEEAEETEETEEPELSSPEAAVELLTNDPVEFEFGYGLIPLADASQGGDLLDRIVMIRRQLTLELGVVLPVVRIRDNMSLRANEYRLKIRGEEVANGEVLLDHLLALGGPGAEKPAFPGIETKDPAFGTPALWIEESVKETAESAGFTVVDPPSVVSTHLTETFKNHAHELLGRKETKQLIDHLKEDDSVLVEEVIPDLLAVGDVQKVLRNLLQEQVSIRNLPVIFETLADYGKMTKDPALLTEYVRQALSRQISRQYSEPNQSLKVVTISGQAEKKIAEAVQQTEHGNYLAMDPADTQKFFQAAAKELKQLTTFDTKPVILCSPAVRMYVRELLQRYFPEVAVLSYNELEPDVEVQSIGVVNIA